MNPQTLFRNDKRWAAPLLMAFVCVLLVSAVSLAFAALNNPNGAHVAALSTSIDSSLPAGYNPLGAKVVFAGTEQTGPDLYNGENTTVWIGLFDPISTVLTRNAATDWSLYQ